MRSISSIYDDGTKELKFTLDFARAFGIGNGQVSTISDGDGGTGVEVAGTVVSVETGVGVASSVAAVGSAVAEGRGDAVAVLVAGALVGPGVALGTEVAEGPGLG